MRVWACSVSLRNRSESKKTVNDVPPPDQGTQPKLSRLAVTSLVFGSLSVGFLCIGPLFAIPAVICGHIARLRIKHSFGRFTGEKVARNGLITGYVSIGLCVLLLPIAIPYYLKSRTIAEQNTCNNYLMQIEGAKQQWALEHKKAQTETPTMDDLKPYFGRDGGKSLKCPVNGTYTIASVGQATTCSIPSHHLQ